MATPRRPIYYTGDANCPSQTFGPNDCLFDENLPAALPDVWNATSAYAIGDTVFYNNSIWITRAAISERTSASPNTAPSLSRDNVWEHIGASLTRLTGSDGVAALTAANAGFHEMRFAVTEGNSAASIQVATDTATSGNNDALVTVNFPTGGGGTTIAAGNGIDVSTSDSTSTISALPFFDKVSLFLGFRDENLDEMVTLSGTEYTAEAYLQNQGLETWYFIDGVERSGSRFITGNGLWTNADLFTGVTIDGTNSFNLIG